MENNCNLTFTNLLSFRKTITEKELKEEMDKIKTFLDKNNLEKVGPVISTTYAVNQAMIPTMDTEILIPINEEFTSNEKYTFKKEFKLVNAIKTSHIGNPANFQETIMEMQKYITENNLKPITSLYNVTINEAKSPSEVDDLHIDLYLGISPNIL